MIESRTRTSIEGTASELTDFSLVLGGPLYQIWRRTGLAGDVLQLLHRRLVALTVLAWVPLLIFSIAQGHAWGGEGLPFLGDVELHASFLLAMPLLILAELIVHTRVRPVIRLFVERRLISDPTRADFDAAIGSALRLRNSVWAELAIIVFVYVVGVGLVWRTQIALDVPSWHGAPLNGRWQLTMAGWWLGLVASPCSSFSFSAGTSVCLSGLDSCGTCRGSTCNSCRLTRSMRWTGLPGLDCVRFTPLLLAQGVVLAGMIADRISTQARNYRSSRWI